MADLNQLQKKFVTLEDFVGTHFETFATPQKIY